MNETCKRQEDLCMNRENTVSLTVRLLLLDIGLNTIKPPCQWYKVTIPQLQILVAICSSDL